MLMTLAIGAVANAQSKYPEGRQVGYATGWSATPFGGQGFGGATIDPWLLKRFGITYQAGVPVMAPHWRWQVVSASPGPTPGSVVWLIADGGVIYRVRVR